MELSPRAKFARVAAQMYFSGDYDEDYFSRHLLDIFTDKDEALTGYLAKIVGSAHKKCLKFKTPEISRTKPYLPDIEWMHKFSDGSERPVPMVAVATDRPGYQIIVHQRAFNHNLDEYQAKIVLAGIIAHELSHIIDEDSKRIGHPIFDKIRHLGKELFADALGAYLVGPYPILRMREVHTFEEDYMEELHEILAELNEFYFQC